ncbi:MAG: molybdopterin-binding/glycosyltransferase family 2 protein [Hyphomicrobiaceae bacterium]|nr:molybdopterin-binding/glycosyltransferase family 2 protein [Hyphomicrobiaceae bacterium]
MKFARFPLSEAQGAILAHSISLPKGVLKKGRVLSLDDIARLSATGHDEVVAARLEPGDVGEDEAARRVAIAAVGAGTHAAAPFTGRANLIADATGLAVIEAGPLARINALDEGLTIATVPPFERVTAGQMIATVKVITFAVPERVVAEAESILRSGPPLASVRPFAARTAGLVLTRMAATKAGVLEKRRQAIADRLRALGSRLGPVETVAHEEAAVSAAIRRMQAAGAEPIIVFAASAIVDRGDVIPVALETAGGEIVRLGMPVDPGNLMLLGRLGGTDVIGAPSCAASPKLNGFDWVLERRLAGLEVGSADVAAMGLGGLLKEIATRPQPREGGGDADGGELAEAGGNGARHAPRIAALVLAAGRSTRFGSTNKLLADLDGKPVVRRTVEAVLQSAARPILVVTGHMADEVRAALAGLDVTFADSPRYRDGLAASLKSGLQALPGGVDGVVVALGDMPGVLGSDIDRLISGFAPKEGRAIVVPTFQGKRGNPVLFAAHLIPEIRDVEGDIGAKPVIGRHADEVAEVDLGSPRIFVDVDTPEALDQVRRGE